MKTKIRENSYNYMLVIKSIRSLIEKNGLKQGYVAKKAGFTDQEFSNMLANRLMIKAEYIPRIAKALGTTPNEIFAYKEWAKMESE